MNHPRGRRSHPCAGAALLILAVSLVAGCGSTTETETTQAGAETAAAARAPASTPVAAQAPFSPVDACTLLTKADVESITGKKVLDGRKEDVAELVMCSFGDPTAPEVGGRPLSQVLTLSVMTGREGAYYAGAAAQAKDSFQMMRNNAGKAEPVAGIGDDAYWDSVLTRLVVVKGKHLIDVDVEGGANSQTAAKAAATKAMGKLPSD